MNIGTRILLLLEEQGLSRSEFARRIHVNYSTANGYILNRRMPDCETLSHIATVLDSSTDFLIGRTNIKYYHDLSYSPTESLLIRNFRSLNKDQQDILLNISQSMYQMQRHHSPVFKA